MELRYPNINGHSDHEKIEQMRRFLYQLIDQLQFALNNTGGTESAPRVVMQSLPQSATKSASRCMEIPADTSLDLLIKPGLYFGRGSGYGNCPEGIGEDLFVLEVASLDGQGQILQRITVFSPQAPVYDRYFITDWAAWECLNPPMYLNTEYRTKERYLGKAVYAKLIDLGNLPNASVKDIAHGVEGITQVLRCLGQRSDGSTLPPSALAAGKTYISVSTADDQSSYTACAQIWYVKV